MEIEKRYITTENVEVRENESGGYIIEGVAALLRKIMIWVGTLNESSVGRLMDD